MAEAVVSPIVADIARQLGSKAFHEIGRLWGFKDELEKLKNRVSTIQAVLLHAEEQYHRSLQVAAWLGRLRVAFRDAEDLLDEIFTASSKRERRSNPVRTFFSISNQLAFSLRMGRKIKAVTERLESIADDRRFLLEERPIDVNVVGVEGDTKREPTYSFVREDEIIGRDDDKRAILELLLGSDAGEDVSIIPIVGIGGLGKTALAQCVFNDERIKGKFESRIWVCVSDVFDMKSIIRQIIASDSNWKSDTMEMEQLQSNLQRVINGKKYLLVLDDLWNEDREKWLKFKTLLMGGLNGSKVLITTRNPRVAEITRTVPLPHILGGLSEDMSWSLFRKMAFRQGEEVKDLDFVSIGKLMLGKCKGVPLAIRCLGSLLFTKNTKAEWEYIRDQELLEIDELKDGIIPFLKLSYNHLPQHLKQCFAYCSVFPKDYEIEKWTLISLWMAQGFIQSKKNQEHVGEEYFMHLLSRNFFQDVIEDQFGNVEYCKMHDLMNDVARSVACEESMIVGTESGNHHERTLHLSYNLDLDSLCNHICCVSKAERIRTLLSTAPPWWLSSGPAQNLYVSKAVLYRLISGCRFLRVLDVHKTNIHMVPSSICKLEHLRYLDLSGNPITRLPGSIVKLQNLQTLKLFMCKELKELPGDVKKLVSLRHLDIRGCIELRHLPSGLGELTSLSVLTNFVLSKDSTSPRFSAQLGELSGLNSLRGELQITNIGCFKDPALESKSVNLSRKHLLQSLELSWWYLASSIDNETSLNHELLLEGLQPHINLQRLSIISYKGTRFPSWMMDRLPLCLPNLVEISFWFCANVRYLPPLGQLPCLKSLSLACLKQVECIENAWNVPDRIDTSFPRLSSLHICSCPKLTSIPLLPHLKDLSLANINEAILKQSHQFCELKNLRISGIETHDLLELWLQDLISLKYLSIGNCPRLICLPLGVQDLTKLEDLFISDCNELDLSSDKNGNALQLQGLENLRNVTIRGISKLVSFPEWLLHLTDLKSLSIKKCANLVALPEWMGDLSSLQRLQIVQCPTLTAIPDSVQHLGSLKYLRIAGCPHLQQACRKETGKDWRKIAHVPEFTDELFDYEKEN